MNFLTSRVNSNFELSEDDKEQRKCLSITLLFTSASALITYPNLPIKLATTELMVGFFLVSLGLSIQDVVKPNTGFILPCITIISISLISIAGLLSYQHPIIVSGENCARIPFALLIIGATLLTMRLMIKYAKYVDDYNHQEQADNIQNIALASSFIPRIKLRA